MKFSNKLASLTPPKQRKVMEQSEEHFEAVKLMNDLVEKIPNLYETDGMERHPLSLHYFYGGCDWYITEWDGEDQFFGYVILGNDLKNSEWGYISKSSLLAAGNVYPAFNLDFHCTHKTVEEALYERDPNYFSKYKEAVDEN